MLAELSLKPDGFGGGSLCGKKEAGRPALCVRLRTVMPRLSAADQIEAEPFEEISYIVADQNPEEAL